MSDSGCGPADAEDAGGPGEPRMNHADFPVRPFVRSRKPQGRGKKYGRATRARPLFTILRVPAD